MTTGAKFLALFERVGSDPTASDEERLQTRLLVAMAALIAVAAYGWGLGYFAFGEMLAGSIPFSYAVLSTLSIALFALNRRFTFFRNSQFVLIVLLPFLLQLALGGFVASSGVIVWSMLGPLGALVVLGRRPAFMWFGAYVVLVALSSFLQPTVEMSLSRVTILTFFVLNIVGVSTIAFMVLAYFVGQKDRAMLLLAEERQRSEQLLYNVLPASVAEVLKESPGTIAEEHPAVSILFADIVGFTPLSEQLSPVEMVTLLNDLFSSFDAIAGRLGVEKLRTIGDNYMVVAGVPDPRADHAEALARMALSMIDHGWDCARSGGVPLEFRIGICSGPVLAGVIGDTRLQYDVWGDAVNIAARMESHGEPGRIQVSETTYELLKDRFVLEPRGTIDVKGKGPMPTWFLLGERPDA